MPRRTVTLTILVLAALGLIGLRQPAGAQPSARAYLPMLSCAGCFPRLDTSGYREEVIRLVNTHRVAAGCPVAVANPILMRAAQDWTAWMDANNRFVHAPPGYYGGYGYTGGGGENLGVAGTPAQVVLAWSQSPPHNAEMTWCYEPDDPSNHPDLIYEIGVGYVDGYWTLAMGHRIP